MPEIPARLITYCTNIHPGESWQETYANLCKHIPLVKSAVSPCEPFPLGLRLSARAAAELTGSHIQSFRDWLDAQGCFVPTLNGFPFAGFHGDTLKERVYLPDWRSPERTAYTIRLAELLADLLPAGVPGSISTVPLGFRGAVAWEDLPLLSRRLETVLARLARIEAERGRTIVLALEPEPGCLLETTEDVCRFFAECDLPPELRPFLGLCYDCCHQAVVFEDPLESWQRLRTDGIPVAKIQVSSALRACGEETRRLQAFAEPHYLHQVVVRRADGGLHRYADLPEAFARHNVAPEDEWRCHFHVPIFCDDAGALGTTRDFLERFLPLAGKAVLFEVETYTWALLPAPLRLESVTESIIREINWLKGRLDA